MTEVLTRTPLDTLSMSAQQDGRRRSAKQAFGEDDAQPSKKTKLDDAPMKTTKSANGRKSTAPPKKAKATYDEDADGFTFSRAKTKKPTVKAPRRSEHNVPAPADESSAQPQPKRGRTKRSTDVASDRTSPKRTRRSARLSGEQNHEPAQEKQPNGAQESDDARLAMTPRSTDLHVEKKRGPTKIALPFADTPVIMRNKQMRKDSAEGRRRSSSGQRGRRASSLIDSGASNALPHSEVETGDFYKHIHQDLHEPRRMKQLLVWCGTRALPPRPTGTAQDLNAVLAARTIQEELLRDFSNKNEMSDWFNREDIAPTALVKKPNPRNLQNAAKLLELEEEIKRLKAEKASWDNLLNGLASTSKQMPPPESFEATHPDPLSRIDTKTLTEPQQTSILFDLRHHQSDLGASRSRLAEATRSLEFKMDTVADGVHKMNKVMETGSSTVDAVLAQAATLLQQRDDAATASAGTERVGIGDLLRSLSRAT